MLEITYLTPEGYQKLMDDLKHAVTVERPEISRQIAEARDKGDLSENAEYDAAKDAQGMLEIKIAKLEDTIANARIIENLDIDPTKVYILSKVRLINHNLKKELTYILVSHEEADHKIGKISVQSPIGRSLLGKSAGEVVEVEVPAGKLTLEILEISR
jgi:transcription elongation factor GreA